MENIHRGTTYSGRRIFVIGSSDESRDLKHLVNSTILNRSNVR